MLALLNAPLKTLYKFTPDLLAPDPIQVDPARTAPTQIQFDDGMASHHTCPCCTSLLLRHISHSTVYWRCSHCRAPMAVWRQWG